jgi:flagellar biosynthetic protein FliQ
MTPAETVDIVREAIIVSLELGAPIMLLALAVGLVISLFQALTQIQEQTLTFVPKVVVIMLAMMVLLPFMLTTLSGFTERLVDRIIVHKETTS